MASTTPTIEIIEIPQEPAGPACLPLPPALHRAESDLPFVPYQEGVTFQLIQVDSESSEANRVERSSVTSTLERSLRSPLRGRGSTSNTRR